MKKRLALILAASMALMTACQGNSGTAATTAAANNGEKAAAPAGSEAALAGTDYGFPAETTITWIVPGKAGGGSDLAIRYLSESMTKNLGLTNTVTNYDSNTIGHQTCANSAADGSTVMLATAALNIQYITGNADLNPRKDLTMIACLQDNGFSALCVPADAPYSTFGEFVEYAKAHPGELNAGQPNSGNNTFQFGMIEMECGIDLNAVECSSESDRLTNLAGGFIDIGFAGVKNAYEYEQAGKLKVIGTMAGDGKVIADFGQELPENFKTCQEQGYENVYWNVHHYVYGPAGMDAAQVEKMNAACKVLIEDADCAKGISGLGQLPEWYNVEDSKKMLDDEMESLAKVAKSLNIYVQE